MDIADFIINSTDIGFIIFTLKTLLLFVGSFFTFLKISNTKNLSISKYVVLLLFIIILSILSSIIKYKSNYFTSMMFLTFLSSCLFSIIFKIKLGNSILITLISFSINYIVYFITVVISFIPVSIINIQNFYIDFTIILFIYSIMLYSLLKIKRFKNGFTFLQKNFKNEYFDILILNISVAILLSAIMLNNFNLLFTINLSFSFIIFSTISFITIQKSFTMYYKHKLLVTELNDTKAELKKKNKEIDSLEAEILEFSKTSHSIAHKQKSLEHKLNKLMLQTEVAEELDLHDRLDSISNEYSKNVATTPLPKTDIEIIDDMISCMSSECKDNNIDFELQLNGNIHHMINNLVTKEDLEILLADHIKDAIIAINYSDNVNKSILVKLGLFNGNYLLSIYDSGIEFEIETLINLGIKPSTTHSDNGGTGMGFMNTFDTLRKHNASLYINELNKPSKDNYTKSVTISFNNQNEYKVTSYRADEIKKQNNRENLIVE